MKLKPCPFCGSEAVDRYNKDTCYCLNEDCALFAKVFLFEDWNTRPIEDQQAAEIERLKEAFNFAKQLFDISIRSIPPAECKNRARQAVEIIEQAFAAQPQKESEDKND